MDGWWRDDDDVLGCMLRIISLLGRVWVRRFSVFPKIMPLELHE